MRKVGGRTDRMIDGQTDMMKIIVAFHNFSHAPKVNEVKQKYLFFFFFRNMVPFLFNTTIFSSLETILHHN
jgi:hypothetical protein